MDDIKVARNFVREWLATSNKRKTNHMSWLNPYMSDTITMVRDAVIGSNICLQAKYDEMEKQFKALYDAARILVYAVDCCGRVDEDCIYCNLYAEIKKIKADKIFGGDDD